MSTAPFSLNPAKSTRTGTPSSEQSRAIPSSSLLNDLISSTENEFQAPLRASSSSSSLQSAPGFLVLLSAESSISDDDVSEFLSSIPTEYTPIWERKTDRTICLSFESDFIGRAFRRLYPPVIELGAERNISTKLVPVIQTSAKRPFASPSSFSHPGKARKTSGPTSSPAVARSIPPAHAPTQSAPLAANALLWVNTATPPRGMSALQLALLYGIPSAACIVDGRVHINFFSKAAEDLFFREPSPAKVTTQSKGSPAFFQRCLSPPHPPPPPSAVDIPLVTGTRIELSSAFLPFNELKEWLFVHFSPAALS